MKEICAHLGLMGTCRVTEGYMTTLGMGTSHVTMVHVIAIV